MEGIQLVGAMTMTGHQHQQYKAAQRGSANSLIRCGAVKTSSFQCGPWPLIPRKEASPPPALFIVAWRGRLRYDRKRYRRRHRQKQNVVKNEFSLIGLGQINVIRDGMGWDGMR